MLGFLILVAFVFVVGFLVYLFLLPFIVGSMVAADDKLREQMPQTLAAVFDGRGRVTYQVPSAFQPAQVIEFGEAHGYQLEMSIPGQSTPTLVFDRVGGADPSWLAPTSPAGRTWGATTEAGPATPPKWKKELRVLAVVVLGASVLFTFSMCSTSSNSGSSSRVNAGLHESTAEAACEREVLDRLAGSPTLKRSSNLAIEGGGWAIYGTATLDDGARMDYSCTVTGSDGNHEVKVTSLG